MTIEGLWVTGFGIGILYDDAGDWSIWLGPLMIVFSQETGDD